MNLFLSRLIGATALSEGSLEFPAEVEFDRPGGLGDELKYLFGPLQFDADFDSMLLRSAPKNVGVNGDEDNPVR